MSRLAKLYIFISWQGALTCSIILGVLLWVERAQNDAYERMYRAANKKFQQAKLQAQKLQHKGGDTENEVSGVSDDDKIPSSATER